MDLTKVKINNGFWKKRKDLNINRVYKLVDTCAAEFEAKTPYYYSTFEMNKISNGKKIAENESTKWDV